MSRRREELEAALADLKREIATAATIALSRFEERSGLTPRAISINMVDVTTFSDAMRVSRIGAVRVDLGEF